MLNPRAWDFARKIFLLAILKMSRHSFSSNSVRPLLRELAIQKDRTSMCPQFVIFCPPPPWPGTGSAILIVPIRNSPAHME